MRKAQGMGRSRNFSRYLLAGLLTASVIGTPAIALADAIKSIKVEGAQRIEAATVMSYVDLRAGDQFDNDKLNRALKSLFATGLFADVSLYQEGEDLIISVTENPIINEIRFEGNDKIKKDNLQSEIQLRARTVLTRSKVQADVERLQDLYRLSGRFSARIEPKIIKLDQNRVNLVFEISEGPKTLISRIVFLGNKHFEDGRLQEVVRSSEKRWWRFLTDDDKYDPDRLDYDRELLRKFYLDEGYADFRVDSAIAELSPDQKSFYVTFSVDEGARYKFGKIAIESNLGGLDPASLNKEALMKEGDWYKASSIEKTINKITEALGKRQYAFVDVVPKVDRNPETKAIGVTFTVNPGKKLFVENININGNVRTLDEVIRREMTLSEGDPLNMARIKKSEQNLRNLTFFENVQVKPTPGSEPEKTNLDVTVAEKSTGELSIGGGFSTNDGPLADFRIKEKNFLGKGQELVLATTLAARRTEYDFSFTEPYFLKRDLSAGIDLFHITQDYQDQSSYDSQRTGGGLRLGYPLSDNWRQLLNYRYQDTTIDNVDSNASVYIKQQAGQYTTSSISQRLTYDTTDNKLQPTAGFIARLDNELAGIGGDARFLKTRLGGTYYVPVTDQWVLSLLGEGGYVFGMGRDVRINERFYIGGDTLRGFANGGIGPRDKITEDALGANAFWRGSAQIDFPSGLPEDLGVRLHTFADYGAAWEIDSSGSGFYDNPTPRLSVGFGLGWSSPMGPVIVDFGIPILKQDYDETEFFRFNFGTRF